MLAIEVDQSHRSWLEYRYREQARSHKEVLRLTAGLRLHADHPFPVHLAQQHHRVIHEFV